MQLSSAPLIGRHVRLEPLADRHVEALHAACDADPDIWTLYPLNMSGQGFAPWWAGLHKRVENGVALAYAVVKDGKALGCSVFSIDAPNKLLEIGNTYLHPDARGGPVNPESKRLMLAHGFDAGAICIQFRVDALNLRSRAAVKKLGAHEDGVLRASRITWTGRVRDTVVFSILAEEWPMVRDKLDARLAALT